MKTGIEMKSAATAIIGISLLVSSLGCALCDNSLDNNYASFGGLVERTDHHGRVGSSFSPHLPSVGRSGSLSPTDPETNEHDRPRDLSTGDGTAPDRGGDTTDGDSGFEPPNDGGPSGTDEIPEFDSGDFEDLLDEIPSSESGGAFPSDV